MSTVWLMDSVAMERILDSFYGWDHSPSSPDEMSYESKFMKMLCDIYGLCHSAYALVNFRPMASRKPLFLVTHPVQLGEKYSRSFADTSDPLMQAGLDELLPFDWKAICQRFPASKSLFGLIEDFGTGHQGLAIPMKCEDGTRALFSVMGKFNDGEWKAYNKSYRKDFVILANYFHKKVSGFSAQNSSLLTERERHVLQLCGSGKTALEISRILKISVPTAKYFINQSKNKLNSKNTTQTVATAMRLGFIS